MAVEKTIASSSLAEVIDRILDKGIVIDAWVRVSLVGIELLAVEARVVVASVETYLKYAEAIGLTATADKVKPTLEKRPLGKSDPAAAHKGTRQAYMGGRWHEANLYEMDRLQPGHEIQGPAIVEHPATTLVVHPNDTVFVDEWTLLHYRHA